MLEIKESRAVRLFLVILILMISSICCSYSCANDSCDLLYIYNNLPLISRGVEDITSKLFTDPIMLKKAQEAVPNVKRIYANRNPFYAIIIGYSSSNEVFTNRSESQLFMTYEHQSKLAKQQREGLGHKYNHVLFIDQPLGVKYKVDYEMNGEQWTDVGMELIANDHCILSVMVTGSIEGNTEEYIDQQLNALRAMILAKEGTVAFSREGQLFERDTLVANGINMLLTIFLTVCIAVLHRRYYCILVGRITSTYSIVVVTLISLVVISLILYNTTSNQYGFGFYNFALVPLYISIIAVHVFALYKHTGNAVLVALSYMLAGQIVALIRDIMGLTIISANLVVVRSIMIISIICIFIATSKRKHLYATADSSPMPV